MWRTWLAGSQRGRRWRDRLVLRVPLFGPLARRIVVAAFARTLGSSLESGVPLLPALALAPFAAGLAGLAFGAFCVRLSGVYAAMLTLAFAQIAWSAAYQWDALTGGSNGLVGVWPSEWLKDKAAFYYLTLLTCAGAVALPALPTEAGVFFFLSFHAC